MFTPSRGLVLHTWNTHVSAVLILCILAWAFGLPGFLRTAHADQLGTLSDTLSTSAPGAGADHTVRFTTTSGVPADGSTIAIVFPSGFDMSAITEDDVDIVDDGEDLTTGTACGAVQAAVSTTTNTVTIEICSGGGGAIAGGSAVVIEIGTHATASGTGANQVVNHASTGDYELEIGGTMADSGYTRLVIVDAVIVSGDVDTYFTFAIAGVDAGETVNTDPVPTSGTSTATVIAFGTVVPSTQYVMAQDIFVETNSTEGFTVTVEAETDLVATNGATIDSFTDGTGVSVPTGWTGPGADYADPDTYGHWGITTEDISLSDNDSFGNALYAGNFIGSPREIMYATSSADGTTDHVGTTRVGYKLQISSMQESAQDYSTNLIYVATPMF